LKTQTATQTVYANKVSVMNIADLETLDYPPLTADLEEAKAHLDEYGMA